MDFLSGLRMNNIFGKQEINPDELSNLLNRSLGAIANFRSNEQLREREALPRIANAMVNNTSSPNNFVSQMMGGPRTNPMTEGKPNMVVSGGMTDFQRASLDLDREKLRDARALSSQKLEGQDEDRDIRQQRADVYKYKAENPGLKTIMTKGGNVMFFNPITGETTDTGIPTGSLSEREKLELTGEQRMSEIEARGTNSEDLARLRGGQTLAEIAARIQGNKEVKEIGLTDKPMLPSQIKVQQGNTARELMNTRPDLAPFIKMSPDGTFTITPAGETNFWGKSTGPTPEQAKEINETLYPPAAPKATKPAPKKDEKKPEVKSKYQVTVK